MDLGEAMGMAVLMGGELHLIGGRGTAVKGYVDNRSTSAADDEHPTGPPAASPAVP